MQSLALQSAHFDAFCPSQVSSAGSVHFSAWTMSLTRVQDVSVHDIHKRKKPRKHYVSQYFCVVLCLVATWQLVVLLLSTTTTLGPFLAPGHVRESKTVLDSGLHAVGSRYCILQSLAVEIGFRIPKTRIPESTRKIFPDSLAWGNFKVIPQ